MRLRQSINTGAGHFRKGTLVNVPFGSKSPGNYNHLHALVYPFFLENTHWFHLCPFSKFVIREMFYFIPRAEIFKIHHSPHHRWPLKVDSVPYQKGKIYKKSHCRWNVSCRTNTQTQSIGLAYRMISYTRGPCEFDILTQSVMLCSRKLCHQLTYLFSAATWWAWNGKCKESGGGNESMRKKLEREMESGEIHLLGCTKRRDSQCSFSSTTFHSKYAPLNRQPWVVLMTMAKSCTHESPGSWTSGCWLRHRQMRQDTFKNGNGSRIHHSHLLFQGPHPNSDEVGHSFAVTAEYADSEYPTRTVGLIQTPAVARTGLS